ncbi:hypothetical protein L1887_23949 [Cichorium endivia]|nr:hypothetical protein L1887_23949 [Cichorium endivia]
MRENRQDSGGEFRVKKADSNQFEEGRASLTSEAGGILAVVENIKSSWNLAEDGAGGAGDRAEGAGDGDG